MWRCTSDPLYFIYEILRLKIARISFFRLYYTHYGSFTPSMHTSRDTITILRAQRSHNAQGIRRRHQDHHDDDGSRATVDGGPPRPDVVLSLVLGRGAPVNVGGEVSMSCTTRAGDRPSRRAAATARPPLVVWAGVVRLDGRAPVLTVARMALHLR